MSGQMPSCPHGVGSLWRGLIPSVANRFFRSSSELRVSTNGNSAKFRLGMQCTENLEIRLFQMVGQIMYLWNTFKLLPKSHPAVLLVEAMDKYQCTKHACLNNQGKEMTHGCYCVLLLPALEDTSLQYIDCWIHIMARKKVCSVCYKW